MGGIKTEPIGKPEEPPRITADYKFVERMKGTKGIIRLYDILKSCPFRCIYLSLSKRLAVARTVRWIS